MRDEETDVRARSIAGTLWTALASLLSLAGCAGVWGFQDLIQGEDAGIAIDGGTVQGSGSGVEGGGGTSGGHDGGRDAETSRDDGPTDAEIGSDDVGSSSGSDSEGGSSGSSGGSSSGSTSGSGSTSSSGGGSTSSSSGSSGGSSSGGSDAATSGDAGDPCSKLTSCMGCTLVGAAMMSELATCNTAVMGDDTNSCQNFLVALQAAGLCK